MTRAPFGRATRHLVRLLLAGGVLFLTVRFPVEATAVAAVVAVAQRRRATG